METFHLLNCLLLSFKINLNLVVASKWIKQYYYNSYRLVSPINFLHSPFTVGIFLYFDSIILTYLIVPSITPWNTCTLPRVPVSSCRLFHALELLEADILCGALLPVTSWMAGSTHNAFSIHDVDGLEHYWRPEKVTFCTKMQVPGCLYH